MVCALRLAKQLTLRQVSDHFFQMMVSARRFWTFTSRYLKAAVAHHYSLLAHDDGPRAMLVKAFRLLSLRRLAISFGSGILQRRRRSAALPSPRMLNQQDT
jgi:hypothetical protein